MYLHEALHAASLRPVRRAGWEPGREAIEFADWKRSSGPAESGVRITIARMLVTLAGREQFWPTDHDLASDDWEVVG